MPFFRHGFIRVACAVPVVLPADPEHNTNQIVSLLRQAEERQAALVVFPELCLTGYTCGDLFQHAHLLDAALAGLRRLREATAQTFSGVAVVGLPLRVEGQLYNAAAVLAAGRILGVIPKLYLPNYREFYEARWFQSGRALGAGEVEVELFGQTVPVGGDLVFPLLPDQNCHLGVEICEDLWMPEPPSSRLALKGATLLCNLSASNDLIGKTEYRRNLVTSQSGRCIAGYLYASCGAGESTTDVVFGGHCLIAENGALLAESARFAREPSLLVSEIDLERLAHDRLRQGTFGDSAGSVADPEAAALLPQWLPTLTYPSGSGPLNRPIDPHPFVPKETKERDDRCAEIFALQVAGLARRLEAAQPAILTLGVSGGLDSTLALLVACKTLDLLRRPRTDLMGLTMPGYGTSRRTLENARTLLRHLGVAWQEIDIRATCLDEMRLLDHRPFGIDLAGLDVESFSAELSKVPPSQRQDLVFENVQARRRTSLLMNRGFVVGTGDLSELAVGWCTYNADHMSMYNPNVSIPKTLVKWLVSHVAEREFSGPVAATLRDIVATEISPELLPLAADGTSGQSTEAVIGPYELIDFFLYHFLRFGAAPRKILYLAEQAKFTREYATQELRHWLAVFLRRFFVNQFKRSCLPDGPKVGTVCLSPRGDWRMPSDASAAAWIAELEE